MNVSKIKLSIIVPFYNVEKYFVECLNSILSYKNDDIEVLLIDDCGQDSSKSIAESYANLDSRVKVITHSFNKKQGAARNTGLRECCGEYVWFVDSDDLLVEGCIEKIIECFEKTKSCAFLYKYKCFFADSPKTSYHVDYVHDFESLKYQTVDQVLLFDKKHQKELFLKSIVKEFCNAWALCFKRSFLLENNFFFKENTYLEDAVTILWLTKSQSISYCHDITSYIYRIRINSATREKVTKGKYRYNIVMLREVIEFCSKYDAGQDKFLSYLSWCRIFRLIYGDFPPFLQAGRRNFKRAVVGVCAELRLAKTKLMTDFDLVFCALLVVDRSNKNARKIANVICEKSTNRELKKAIEGGFGKYANNKYWKIFKKAVKFCLPHGVIEWRNRRRNRK
ncbi:MAG: glycosyltransferase family 2 protein [Clostridiales bacterium]|jgi:glycosyltransferase involved in cell wall biosynthesis|nr:glycosyltransferase family 2 protein [Clostridiales bacterium]